MSEKQRVKAKLKINGEPLPDDVQLDVFICNRCDGKGRYEVITGGWMNSKGQSGVTKREQRCEKCHGSGYVVSLYRKEATR
jgi:DnaJ-class molecular chaperone